MSRRISGQLAQRELQSRADIFTHDALAWALTAAGRTDEAWPHMEKALAEGTIDAPALTHAGVLAAKLGHTTKAESWLTKARSLEHMLLPSERQNSSPRHRPPWRHRTALHLRVPQ